MILKRKIKLMRKPRSRSEVLKNSLPCDILEVSVNTENSMPNKIPKMRIKNLTTGESAEKHFNFMAKLLDDLTYEEVE